MTDQAGDGYTGPGTSGGRRCRRERTPEFYDFLTFSFFAVYIGRTFFPSERSVGKLAGFIWQRSARVLSRVPSAPW